MVDAPSPNPMAPCDRCADDFLQAEYDRQHRFLWDLLGSHVRDHIVMAAVSVAIAHNGGLLGSLGVAESLCLDAARKLREVREVANG
jgi:hypothetical protein